MVLAGVNLVSVRINCEMTHKDEEGIVLWHLKKDETALDKCQVLFANNGIKTKWGRKISSCTRCVIPAEPL